MICKYLISTVLLFSLAFVTNGQKEQLVYPKIKIRAGAGFSINDFYGQQPFPNALCRIECFPVVQKALPSFTFGGQATLRLRRKHYIGAIYRWHQIRLEQENYDLFSNNIYQDKVDLTYHSFGLVHQYQLNPSKKYLWWNNAIGIDKSNGENNFKTWPLFYRTSLSFQIKYHKNRGLAMHPFFQIGLTPYTKKRGDQKAVMRPMMLGLMLDIPYDVY